MDGIVKKDMPAEFKVNLEQRQFEGYASTFGNEDLVGDIMERGCYRKTIAERGPKGSNDIKVLWGHMDPFGMPLELHEDDHGLWVVGQASDTQENKDRLVYMRDGVVKTMSVGFKIPAGKSWFEDDGWIRHIQEAKLYEFSPVMFPANEEAVIANVAKQADIAMLVKSIGKDAVVQNARLIDQNDPLQIKQLIEYLKEIRTVLLGTEEEKQALRTGREPSGDTPDTNPEPPAENGPPELQDEDVKALEGVLEELALSNALRGVRQ